jgi:hypothetical protein
MEARDSAALRCATTTGLHMPRAAEPTARACYTKRSEAGATMPGSRQSPRQPMRIAVTPITHAARAEDDAGAVALCCARADRPVAARRVPHPALRPWIKDGRC